MNEVLEGNTTNKEINPPDAITAGSLVTLRFSDDDFGAAETYIITDGPRHNDVDTRFTDLPISSPLGQKIRHMKAGETLTFKSERSGAVDIEILSVDNSIYHMQTEDK